MSVCVACADRAGGCERCKGGPGEQGFSLDEKELLQLRDRVRELEAERDVERAEFIAYVDAAKKAAGWITDLPRGFGYSGRPLAETVAEMRERIRNLERENDQLEGEVGQLRGGHR